jgi:hypothetical protein
MAEPGRLQTGAIVVGAAAAGAIVGWLAGGAAAAAAAGALGLLTGIAVGPIGVRPTVAVPVAVGGAVGFVLGRSVVRVLCAPQGCVAVEWIAGIATAIGALVGVGLVVALASRSFDEYREALTSGRPPPDPEGASDEPPESP